MNKKFLLALTALMMKKLSGPEVLRSNSVRTSRVACLERPVLIIIMTFTLQNLNGVIIYKLINKPINVIYASAPAFAAS